MRLVAAFQNAVARAIGLAPSERGAVVATMLQPRSGDGVGYWLQLLIATALATLGLALDSTAVVIGAMLIAPLMRPIVELAMGLATGSVTLVTRAGLRAVASVLAVVAAATLISWCLPFHEVTRELAARTAPSLLDLFVAAACALAGAYATIFSSRELATTAAGTSIGISLVPPLGTVGYGISTGNWPMASGAALLFTANIAGIIAVASVVFALVGFGQVDSPRRLPRVARVLLPVLLLAAIFVPLRQAVVAMARRSALRQELETILQHSGLRIADSKIDVDARGALVRVVIVGDAAAAQSLDGTLRLHLARIGDDTPHVSVWAVPDASALGALATRIDELPPPMVVTPSPPAPPPAIPTASELAQDARDRWPTSGTGAPVAVVFRPAVGGLPLEIEVTHFGAPIGPAACELLAHEVGTARQPLVVSERSLEVVSAPPADAVGFAARAFSIIEASRGIAGLSLCLEIPAPPATGREPAAIATMRELFQQLVESRPDLTITTTAAWHLVPVMGSCPEPPVAPVAPVAPQAAKQP